MASTVSDYGVTWDEPPYFRASDRHIQWLANFAKNLVRGGVAENLRAEVITAAWRSDSYYVPHPPFSRIVSGLTKAVFAPLLDPFSAYRLGPALFFALLATVMYVWTAAVFDRVTGAFSALALVLIPNLFGFAHLAVTDMPLAALWFVTAYCFWRGLEDWRWSVATGIVWGLALSTKFPALLIPVPLLLWAHLFHRRSYHNNIVSMIFLSPLVMIASQPNLWERPFMGILTFLYEGVSRGYRPETNYPIFFYNQLLLSNELPWYYPFFIIGITTPETILALSLLGGFSAGWLKARRDVLVLFLFNALFVPAMGLFPGAVLHDGVRQLLSALPFLAALAGGGFFFLVETLKKIPYLRAKFMSVAVFLFLIPPALSVFTFHPYELSYYNYFVGGLRGAYERGLEVTYFMEAFTPDFLRRLNEGLPPGAIINASFANFMFKYYQNGHLLRADLRITEGDDYDYYILLNRKSAFSEKDFALLASKPRLYDALRLDGVPLVLILKKRES